MGDRIVVTGAAGVLGGAVARYLADKGATVVGIDMASATDLPTDFIGDVDLTEPDRAAAVFARIGSEGPIDGLVNIAGGFRWETIENGAAETWDLLYRMNVATTLNATRAALPFLLADGGGAIVNVGAAATARAGTGMGAYTASKSAVARLTEALAEECKDRRLRVNAVLPSIIDTPANRAEMGTADADRWVQPIELAQVVGFLLSADASAVTGACLPVTGRI
jgi:NAD(P)-dependent dehydrogenase (short-subunit alcohol dehydrogenase family)